MSRKDAPITLGFHGAARTVTGSRYQLIAGGRRTVIDCGLFQGLKQLRELNWREPPFPAHEVDRVLLTHAHIDHIGMVPRLVRNGFRGPIHCTRSTLELARLLLLDSAEIHEEDARYANKKGYSKHKPAKPLYTVEDAKRAIKQLEKVDFGQWLDVGGGVQARWHGAGHILGAASIELEIEDPRSAGRTGTLLMSGDIGRYGMPLHLDPAPRPAAQVIVCESTYGDRDHDHELPVEEQLRQPIARCIERGGTVLIPAFAVGRSQQLTLVLRRLMTGGQLPQVPIHIDSPMAVDATEIYSRHLDEHHVDADVFADGRGVLFPDNVELCRSVSQSKALNDLPGPRIIISASGMLTAGRVVHHLRRLVGDRKNLIFLAGYQAPGTRGRDLLEGAPTVRMFGQDVAVRAECQSVRGLSAHGDRGELMRWLRSHDQAPRQVYLTHGEPDAAFQLAQRIERDLDWRVAVPELDEVVALEGMLFQQ